MTNEFDGTPRYRSLLLCCWEVHSQQPDQPSTWRFSLQNPQTEQKHSFADLEELVAFLRAELDQNRKTESQEGVL